MDREDRRRFFVLGSIFLEIVTPLFRTQLENYYQKCSLRSLRDFLNHQPVLHTLFHLRHRNALCCRDKVNCINSRVLPLIYSQWDLMYVENPGPGIHHCHCKYTAKLVDPSDIDITLLGLILLNCCNLSPQDEDAVRMLRLCKNDCISHNTNASMTQSDFSSAWTVLEKCVLQLDITKQDDLTRILKRPLDEALCQRYFVHLLDIHKKLEELDTKLDRQFNQHLPYGANVLHIACRNNHIEIVKLLLERTNIDPAEYNKLEINLDRQCRQPLPNDDTVLRKAVECGDVEIVKLLLERTHIDQVVKNKVDIDDSFKQMEVEPQFQRITQKLNTNSAELFIKIKGKGETKEREHYLQILAFLLGDRMPIINAFIEQVVLKENCSTFEDFLNTEKHIIFHEYMPNYPCCCCNILSLAKSSKRPSLCIEDFLMLYDQTKGTHSHFIKRNKKIIQHCICGMAAKKGVCIDVINTDVANMILKKFSGRCVHYVKELQEIRRIRNCLWSNGQRKIEESQFDEYWSVIMLSFLGLAVKTSVQQYRYVKTQYEFLSNLYDQTSGEEYRSVINLLGGLYVRNGMRKITVSVGCSDDLEATNKLLSKMVYLNFSLGIDVVHTYFETEILKDTDLPSFLNTRKHFMFHQYKPCALCCECTKRHYGPKSLNKEQFKQLYDEVSSNCCGMIDPERECICKFKPCKSVAVDDINIFLISTILNNSFPPITNLKDISKFLLVDLTHSNSKFELLNEKWQMLEKSIIDIAKTVDDTFGNLIQQEVSALNSNDTLNIKGKTLLLEFNDSVQQPQTWTSTITKAEAELGLLRQKIDLQIDEKLPEVNGPWKGKLCESCEFRDIKVIASVGCLVCDQCLCKHCLDHHKATKTFQDHQVVPLDEYMQRPDNKEFVCDKHNLNLNLFCASHDASLCLKCISQDHKSCTVMLMTEAAEQFKTYRLANLKEKTDNLLKTVETAYEKALIDSNSYHLKKVRFLSEFDKTFKVSINRFKTHLLGNLDNNERTTKEIADNLNEQLVILRTLSTELPSDTSLMLNFKTMNKVMDIEKKIKDQEIYFKELESKEKLISSDLGFQFDISTGKNSENNHSTTVQVRSLQTESIQAQDPQDIMNFRLEKESSFTLPKAKKETQIRGCAILDDNTACFADRGNNRLVFMTTKGYLKEIKLPSAPVDIACIRGTQIAVTLYDSKSIKIFDTEKWDWEEFIFRDKHGLTGIAFGDDLIIVRTGGTGYHLLNLKGKKIGTIPKPDSNMPYVACAKDKFYSAKWDTNEVYCFDKSAKTLWQFKDESIINPANGVSADIDGNVYVTGSYSNSVAVISSDGQKCKQLIDSSTNLDNPIAIDYHKTNNKLLVSAASGHAVLYSVIRN